MYLPNIPQLFAIFSFFGDNLANSGKLLTYIWRARRLVCHSLVNIRGKNNYLWILVKYSGSLNSREDFKHFLNFGRTFGEHSERLTKKENVWDNLGNVWRRFREFHKFCIRQVNSRHPGDYQNACFVHWVVLTTEGPKGRWLLKIDNN